MKRLILICAGILALAGQAPAATLLALTDTGELFTSGDDGQSWSVRAALPLSDAAGLAAGATSTDLVMVSRTGTVYTSADAGSTWTAVGSAGVSDVVDLAVLAGGDLRILTASGLVLGSADGGTTWSAAAAISASDLVSLARDAGGRLYALGATGAVRVSDDDGLTWSTPAALPVPDAVSLRAGGGSVYALSGSGWTYRSDDQGATWQVVGTLSQVGAVALVSQGGSLYALTQEGWVASSTDGTGWSWVGAVNQLRVVAAATDEPQVTGVGEIPTEPGRLRLAPPWPNPYRPAAQALHLRLWVEEPGPVRLELIDPGGRLAAGRELESVPGGVRDLEWSPGPLAAGVYFLRVRSGGVTASAPLAVIR